MDKIFKALADKNRRKIVTLLKDSDMGVNQMLPFLNIGQATLSSHLSILRKAKMVFFEVKGRQRVYKLNTEVVSAFIGRLNEFVHFEDFKALKTDIVTRK
jgi:DNA-binding transcriptional ArsR family regulator